MNKPMLTARQEMARRSRRDFAALGVGALAGIAGWTWLRGGRMMGGLSEPMRHVLEFNRGITSAGLFSGSHLAPEFPTSMAEDIRDNGDEGLGGKLDPGAWRLRLRLRGSIANELALDDIRSLPKIEMTTEFKCIEGWSSIVHWGGARFADFMGKFAPDSKTSPYVGMATPDDGYFIGVDMASALHPQTLLCYEMNGKPLEEGHGAPLRLVIPVKYGIKNIKRIGTISFQDSPPEDYWAERGYDYYAGL